MAFSAFNAFGHLRFSSRPPHGEKIYRDTVRALGNGKNYSDDFDSLSMARIYANAMAYARAKYAAERAGSQFIPSRALELLPALEAEYGIIPEDGETITERRTTLAAFMRVARGARRDNVEAVMSELMGADFLAYVTVDKAVAVNSHADPSTVGVYKAPGTSKALFKISSAVSMVGTPVSVFYDPIVIPEGQLIPETPPYVLLVGERVIIDPGHHDRIEAVTVTAVTIAPRKFTATFTKPHDSGVVVASGRHPHLMSTKRHNLFVLSAAAMTSDKKRRKAHRIIRRLLRAISTWSIAEALTATTAGPFKVNQGKLGRTPIGAITF